MRKSIYSENEIFEKCYDRISSLISEDVKVEDLPSKLEEDYLPNEIKLLIKDLGSVKYFKKVDRIQIIYRILSFVVLLQFIINLLLVVFFASLAKDSPTANVDFSYFSMPVFYSLGGLILSVMLVVNSFWENVFSTGIILISFLIFSQVYNDAFVIFETTSMFYWIPVLVFISVFLLTVRLAFPKRERMLLVLRKLKKNGIDISSIPEELVTYAEQFDDSSLLSSYSKAPDSKEFFKNLPYKIKKNPTEDELLNWVIRKRRNNNILIAILGLFLFTMIALIISVGLEKIDVYEIIQMFLGLGGWVYLLLKRESLKKIDTNYINTALGDIKGNNL